VTLAGQAIVGSWVSLIVTVNEHSAVLLAASETVHVTVVVPTLKLEPEAGWQTGVLTPAQLSDAVGVNVTAAPHWPGSLPRVIGAGHAIVGASVSLTVTVNVHAAVLPAASVAVHVTVVTPFAKVAPEAGAHETVAPAQLSAGVGGV
jgi:hypothetical protein